MPRGHPQEPRETVLTASLCLVSVPLEALGLPEKAPYLFVTECSIRA